MQNAECKTQNYRRNSKQTMGTKRYMSTKSQPKLVILTEVKNLSDYRKLGMTKQTTNEKRLQKQPSFVLKRELEHNRDVFK